MNPSSTPRCRQDESEAGFGAGHSLVLVSLPQYLKDPAQHILEALDQDSPAEDDAWDAVSEVSSSEQEPGTPSGAEDAVRTL